MTPDKASNQLAHGVVFPKKDAPKTNPADAELGRENFRKKPTRDEFLRTRRGLWHQRLQLRVNTYLRLSRHPTVEN